VPELDLGVASNLRASRIIILQFKKGGQEMKKALLLFMAILIVILISQSQAQTPAPAPKPNAASRALPLVSGYCLPVSAGFLESEAKASDEMKKCSRGDTIVVPARSAGAVARMCDFSRAIVAIGDNVVCAMVFPERSSR
jgi:hypothetical protein